jgi:3-oxoacyl-[acyl-carrier protein] reductase
MSTTGHDGRRVAVVTGAASGIGRAVAEVLSAQGMRVVGISRRMRETETTSPCDVTDEQTVAAVFGRIAERFGRLDVLVNGAAIVAKTEPLEVSVREWEETLRTNVIGTYLCCREAIGIMQRQRYGRIVNISSIAGRWVSRSASLAYTCSKYAVIGLTRQLAVRFGQEGITINCVCPSETATELFLQNVPAQRREAIATANPLRRLAEPVEVARVIGFLASEAASYMNGTVVDVNGGQR